MEIATYDKGSKKVIFPIRANGKKHYGLIGLECLTDYFDCKQESDALQVFRKYRGTIEAIAIELAEEGEEIPQVTSVHF